MLLSVWSALAVNIAPSLSLKNRLLAMIPPLYLPNPLIKEWYPVSPVTLSLNPRGASFIMRFTVPPSPSASLSAVLAFNTSAPAIISGEIMFKSVLRSLLLVEGAFIPLIATVLYLGSKPLMMIFCPSPPSL